MPLYTPNAVRSVFVTGLQNAHAVEQQALSLIDRQLDRLVHYPEIADRLRSHRRETEDQIRRLDEILHDLRETHSSIKDLALSMIGNLAAMGNVMAGDEVLKNHIVNLAFENLEVASYTSLVVIAEAGSFATATPLLEASLREEQAMAAWVAETLPDVTRKYIGLRAEGRTAGH